MHLKPLPGNFSPDWANPSATKPAFKWVFVQESNYTLGHGFFLNNAQTASATESGSVRLEGPFQNSFSTGSDTSGRRPSLLNEATGLICELCKWKDGHDMNYNIND